MIHSRLLKKAAVFGLVLFLFSAFDWSVPPPDAGRDDYLIMSVLWYQRSAEMRALYYQAFNIARLRIDADIAQNKGTRKRAVVVDIDETILDNSPHSGKLIKENQVFPFAWKEWIDKAEAEPLPGAAEFLNYAASKGYNVYYVSNRSAKGETEGTVENLKKKGFPQVVPEHVMLRENESSKEVRRTAISKTDDIVLLMGDNLNDFASMFERKGMVERSAEADKARDEFGKRFIVLPNPMYGDWEGAVLEYRRGLSDKEKADLRMAALKSF